MKKVLITLIFCVNVGIAAYAESKIFTFNDNIDEYYNKQSFVYPVETIETFWYHKNTTLHFPEGTVTGVSPKKTAQKDDTLLLMTPDLKVIGVRQFQNGKYEFLYDLDDNGTLDIKVPKPIIPVDVFTRSLETKKSSKNNVKKYLDNFYNLFNGTKNPYKEKLMYNMVNDLKALAADTNTINRDVIYSLYMFYGLIQRHPYVDITNLIVVDSLYAKRFGISDKDRHPLFRLHLIETLINLGEKNDAMKETQSALHDYPNYIPFQVYSWQLETDKTKKQMKYKKLKKEHPTHWIVKQI